VQARRLVGELIKRTETAAEPFADFPCRPQLPAERGLRLAGIGQSITVPAGEQFAGTGCS